MRIFDRTCGLERGFAKSHVTKKGKEIFKGISFLENYISLERQHRDGYGNSKFPFFGNLCNDGISRKNLYHHEEEKETGTMVTKDLHVRVAETCKSENETRERILKRYTVEKNK